MDDLLALDGGGAATKWRKQHAARQRRKLQKEHRAEAKANKAKLLREAKADLRRRRAKWLDNWEKRAVTAKAAGLPPPSRMGRPWQLGIGNPQVVDMVGRVFGRLTVVRSAPVSLTMKTAQRCRVWIVKCSCGSPERLVNGTSLRQGNSNSCGCLKLERLRAKRGVKRSKPLSVRMNLMAARMRAQGENRAARLLELGARANLREERARQKGRFVIRLRQPRGPYKKRLPTIVDEQTLH